MQFVCCHVWLLGFCLSTCVIIYHKQRVLIHDAQEVVHNSQITINWQVLPPSLSLFIVSVCQHHLLVSIDTITYSLYRSITLMNMYVRYSSIPMFASGLYIFIYLLLDIHRYVVSWLALSTFWWLHINFSIFNCFYDILFSKSLLPMLSWFIYVISIHNADFCSLIAIE